MRRRVPLFILVCVLAGLMVGGTAEAQQTVSSLIQEGAALYQKGRYDEAIAKFNRAIRLDPRNADAHAWLGRTHLQKALQEFKIVARLAPNTDNGRTAVKWIERIEGTGPASRPVPTPAPSARPPVWLTELQPLSRNVTVNARDERVTIAGVIYERYVQLWEGIYGKGGWAIYDLGRKYSKFAAFVGVLDDTSFAQDIQEYAVLGDGNILAQGKVVKGARAVELSVDVRGVRSLQLKTTANEIVFASPKLLP